MNEHYMTFPDKIQILTKWTDTTKLARRQWNNSSSHRETNDIKSCMQRNLCEFEGTRK